ncbi:hypothetical protein [Sphingobium indicum]|uniref:hypothetical protein n=1 Tax=Sphingobium indicum TaxID=332055 RepID=UPI001F248DB9|nr:hypothetical protein [Sphingobium indicum]
MGRTKISIEKAAHLRRSQDLLRECNIVGDIADTNIGKPKTQLTAGTVILSPVHAHWPFPGRINAILMVTPTQIAPDPSIHENCPVLPAPKGEYSACLHLTI